MLERFRDRLAARRWVVPLRQPEATPQRVPAQDLAAQVEAALERLEAEHHAEVEQRTYGSEAVQLAREYRQTASQHGPITIAFDNPELGVSTLNPITLVDEQVRSHYAGRHSIAPNSARERVLALQRSRGISR